MTEDQIFGLSILLLLSALVALPMCGIRRERRRWGRIHADRRRNWENDA